MTAHALLRGWVLLLLPAVALSACATKRSQIELERHRAPLSNTGPDAIALPPEERFRWGAVVGTVVTTAGERGCRGEVWLQPRAAQVSDVRPIESGRLRNMFRFPQLWPGKYVLGARCLGYRPVQRQVTVRRGEVLRAVISMEPHPLIAASPVQGGGPR